LAIFTAQLVGGRRGALVGGACFIVPAVVSVLLLSVVLQGSPPAWVLGAGAGGGAAVPAIAAKAGWGIVRPGLARAEGPYRLRYVTYALMAGVATATVGPYVVLVLFGLGAFELVWQGYAGRGLASVVLPFGAFTGGLGALCWTAFKVGALSYGGGFVIVPLMQADAVDVHHWMTDAGFLNAVALGQVTPGPVVATVVAVGYAAHGVGGALLAGAVAFAPSFLLVLLGGERFDALRANVRVRAFLDGAAPAAAGAILGAAVPLAMALHVNWQWVVLAAAFVVLIVTDGGVVFTILTAAAVGATITLAGGALPSVA
jgi:chromate transporter